MTADDYVELELEDEIDEEEDVPDEPPAFANLPDGRALVLRGSEAGRVLPEAVEAARAVEGVRSREDALAGRVPLFLNQSSHKYFGREPEVLAALHADYGENLALGRIVRLNRYSAAIARERLDVPIVSIRIADPMGYTAFGDRLVIEAALPKPRHLERCPYLGELRKTPDHYAEDVLGAQRAAGANLLLTTGRGVGAADVAGAFSEISDEADEMFAHLEDGEHLALNLTLPYEFLQNQAVFDDVMAELSELDQFDVVYVRIQRPAPNDAGAPLADAAALRRMFEFGVWADREDVALLHAQTGLTGWLMLASGAVGFSTGGLPSDQTFVRQTSSGGGGLPPLERHFERSILHTVASATHDALVATGAPYREFPTRWGNDALAATPYDQALSAAHSLYSVGALTAETIPSATRRGGWSAGIHSKVHDAHSAAPSLGLGGRESPTHLGSWISVV